MTILLGPVLHLERGAPGLWRFSVHLLTNLPGAPAPALQIAFDAPDVVVGPPQLVANFPAHGRSLWCFVAEVPRVGLERWLTYTLEGDGEPRTFDKVAIPASGKLPRITFFSCNGFSSEALMRSTSDPYALWQQMLKEHGLGLDGGNHDSPSGIHVLVGGGDQIYADSLPVLRELDDMAHRDLRRLRSSVDRRDRALREYLNLYQQRWSQPDVAAMLARVPVVFTWDDHDIFDGWGSHGEDIQSNPAYLDVFDSARMAFRAFQLGGVGNSAGRAPSLLAPANNPGDDHFMQSVILHGGGQELEVLLLDLRSNRTPVRVLSEKQWSDLKGLLSTRKALPNTQPHLLVVASIPVVHMRFKAVGWILRNLVPGAQEVEDDLLDQWEHPDHLGERARMIMTLLQHQQRSGYRVTILSGDVHAGALGRIESTRPEHRQPGHVDAARILQITSSGIVHPSPSTWERYFLELLGTDGRDEVTSGVTTEMLPIDSATDRLWARNFLILDVEGADASVPHQLWARFIAEGRVVAQVVTVPPC